MYAVTVLIETLWNVNRSEQVKRCGNAVVLIETLWNVNQINKIMAQKVKSSFNRNIVECKWRRLRSASLTSYLF